MYTALGLVPYATSYTTDITVDCTATLIEPSVDLNVLGYDNLTITGTNFPKFIEDNIVTITLSNTASSVGPIEC